MLDPRFKAALGEDSDSESSDKENSDQEADGDTVEQQKAKRQKTGIKLQDLEEAGFVSGPSILHIREQAPDLSYEWWALCLSLDIPSVKQNASLFDDIPAKSPMPILL